MSATIVTTVQVKFDGSGVTDISDRVITANINYGRQRLLDEFGAGTATLTLRNDDNFITPGHSDSTQGNTQLIGREVRISAAVTGGSDSYSSYLFRGQIADVDYLPNNDHQSARTILKCVDGFVLLARAKFEGQSFSAETTSTRVTNVLDLASVNYPDESSPNDRSVATGSVTCLSASSQSHNALDYLQQIARTENGKVLVNHAGTPSSTNAGGVLEFIAKDTVPLASGLTISDANSLSSGSIQADDIKLEYGSELLFNSYSMTPATGSVQTGSNSTSVGKYGTRTLSRNVLSNATDANNAGSYYIGLYDEPSLRVSEVTLQADMATVADAEKILHLNVNSSLDLSILPVGSSTTLGGQYIVEGLSIEITPKDMSANKSSIKYIISTSNADTTAYWILGDASLSVLPTILGL
jgi:hypothetical protein